MFLVAAMIGAGAAFALNRAQVNIAFISIGTDYFQVIATLASSRVRWPTMLEELFHVLSAFNLNIELTAPECIVPEVSFVEKWTAFVLLIPTIFAVMMLINLAYSGYKVFCRGSHKRKAFTHTGMIVQMALLLLYFSFYPMVRIVFDALNCSASGNPVERDRNGEPIMYLQAVHEPCDLKDGVHQTLLPWAIIAMLAYAVVYPGFMLWAHCSNRRIFMIDQILRAMGKGETREENRIAYDARKMYSRTYYQLRPDFVHWIFVLLARKYVLAITSLLYVRTPSLQMSSALLVVFFAYTMQVMYSPFMSPARFPAVLHEHERLATEGNIAHKNMRSEIKSMMRHWRKGGHVNSMTSAAPKQLTLERAGQMLVEGAFDYNTLEATLLACALLVMLSGVMFEALADEDNRETEREGLAVLVVVIIGGSIVYFAFVVMAEIRNILTVRSVKEAALRGDSEAFSKAASSGATGGGKSKGSGASASREETGAYAADGAMIKPEKQQVNPMFLKKKGAKDTEGERDIVEASAVRSMLLAPDQEMWNVLREQYLLMTEQTQQLRTRAREAEIEVARSAGSAALGAPTGSPYTPFRGSAARGTRGSVRKTFPHRETRALGGQSSFARRSSRNNGRLQSSAELSERRSSAKLLDEPVDTLSSADQQLKAPVAGLEAAAAKQAASDTPDSHAERKVKDVASTG